MGCCLSRHKIGAVKSVLLPPEVDISTTEGKLHFIRINSTGLCRGETTQLGVIGLVDFRKLRTQGGKVLRLPRRSRQKCNDEHKAYGPHLDTP